MVSIVGAEGTFAGVTATDGNDVSETPTPFTAVTTKVYGVPLVRLLKIMGDEDPVIVLPSDAVTVYEVTRDPLPAGATKATLAPPFMGVATTDVGVSGIVAGVTEADADEAMDVPAAFTAFTVKVYAVPFVNPDIASGLPDVVNDVGPPTGVGLGMTMYPVMGVPPVLVGVSKEIVAAPEVATATTCSGAVGGAVGVTGVDADEETDVPMAFVAVTVKVYAWPIVSPVKFAGLLVTVRVSPPGLAVTV